MKTHGLANQQAQSLHCVGPRLCYTYLADWPMTSSESTGWIGSWSPGIGDPNLIGWVTVALYAIAAVLCHLAARKSKSLDRNKSAWRGESVPWHFLAIALWFLCVNKQLDLQTAMTEFGRILARRQGWYAERHLFQEVFFAVLLLAGFFVACFGLVLTWRMSRWLRLAILGFCIIGAFVLIRASLFQHIAILFGHRLRGTRWSWLLEIGGIGVVAFGARRRLRSPN